MTVIQLELVTISDEKPKDIFFLKTQKLHNHCEK